MGMTRKQRALLERVLGGESLTEVLDHLSLTLPTWNRWMKNPDFREDIAEVVEQKEVREVIDALTLNRRAYNKLLRACNGTPNGNGQESPGRGEEGAGDGIDEKHARMYLSIIEAMAKRLAELAPRLRRAEEEKNETGRNSQQPTPEEYDALAKHLEELRHSASH